MTPALFTSTCSGPCQEAARRDRRRVGQVQLGHLQRLVAGGRGDVLGRAFARGDVAHRQGDLGSGGGQRARRLGADAGRGAGDHAASVTTGRRPVRSAPAATSSAVLAKPNGVSMGLTVT
jgi:hypothetical protein